MSFYLFADDTNLLYADRDTNSLETVVNAELSKVQEWLVASKLTLNANDVKTFDVGTYGFVLLNQKLGILIDSNLTWK